MVTMAAESERPLDRERLLHERVTLMEQVPLFSSLHPDDLSALAERVRAMRFGRGQTIFRAGEPARHLFLIAKGRVKIYTVSPAGREMLVAILGTGQVFGEAEILDGGHRGTNARAMDEVEVLGVGRHLFWAILKSRPAFVRRLLELTARRLRRADQAVQDLVFFDAPARLARRLLELAADHGAATGRGNAIRIDLAITQREIAEMIGVRRTTLNRLVASFTARGWISWNEGSPILLEPEALGKFARS
jgi:CRP/FNR family transcriptional regulator